MHNMPYLGQVCFRGGHDSGSALHFQARWEQKSYVLCHVTASTTQDSRCFHALSRPSLVPNIFNIGGTYREFTHFHALSRLPAGVRAVAPVAGFSRS